MPRVAKHPNRFELKYAIDQERATDFTKAIQHYVHPDPNCTDERGYSIYSVCADSPEHTLFWEKVEGIKYRRKVRFRRYSDSRQS